MLSRKAIATICALMALLLLLVGCDPKEADWSASSTERSETVGSFDGGETEESEESKDTDSDTSTQEVWSPFV